MSALSVCQVEAENGARRGTQRAVERRDTLHSSVLPRGSLNTREGSSTGLVLLVGEKKENKSIRGY